MTVATREGLAIVPTGVVDLDTFRRWTLSPNFPEQGRIDELEMGEGS